MANGAVVFREGGAPPGAPPVIQCIGTLCTGPPLHDIENELDEQALANFWEES